MPFETFQKPLGWSPLREGVSNDLGWLGRHLRGVFSVRWIGPCPKHLVLGRAWLMLYLPLMRLRPPLSRRAARLNASRND